jgi:uncharacterized protein YciI
VEVLMPRLFAVTRSRGPAWNAARPMEEQAEWPAHAVFMNALHRDGFVVLGGPLEGTPDVLLIARANDADEITARLSDDAWARNGLLRITQIVPWTLRLGALGPPA